MRTTWTERAALDGVWAHFVDGAGEPSVRDTEDGRRCAYRGAGDARCAIGVLIDDADYLRTMESLTVGTLVRTFSMPALAELSVSFLSDLQRAHDRATHAETPEAFTRAMRHALTAIARDHRLPVPGTDAREWAAELLYCANACERVPAEIGSEHFCAYLHTQAVRADREGQPAAANVLKHASYLYAHEGPMRAAGALRTLANRFLAD